MADENFKNYLHDKYHDNNGNPLEGIYFGEEHQKFIAGRGNDPENFFLSKSPNLQAYYPQEMGIYSPQDEHLLSNYFPSNPLVGHYGWLNRNTVFPPYGAPSDPRFEAFYGSNAVNGLGINGVGGRRGYGAGGFSLGLTRTPYENYPSHLNADWDIPPTYPKGQYTTDKLPTDTESDAFQNFSSENFHEDISEQLKLMHIQNPNWQTSEQSIPIQENISNIDIESQNKRKTWADIAKNSSGNPELEQSNFVTGQPSMNKQTKQNINSVQQSQSFQETMQQPIQQQSFQQQFFQQQVQPNSQQPGFNVLQQNQAQNNKRFPASQSNQNKKFSVSNQQEQSAKPIQYSQIETNSTSFHVNPTDFDCNPKYAKFLL